MSPLNEPSLLRLLDEFEHCLWKRNGWSSRRPSTVLTAAATEDKAVYIRHRAFDDAHYKQMILDFLKKFGQASREDIDRLLEGKLSDALDEKQKYHKTRNLLQAVRREGHIRNEGSRGKPKWVLAK